jgi:hypothetical protein
VGTGVNFLWLKSPGREVDSCPPLVKVKIDYISTSAGSVCVHGVAEYNFLFIFEKSFMQLTCVICSNDQLGKEGKSVC